MSTIGALTANTDLQSLMAKMYGNGIGKINNAKENLESLLVTNSNDINKNDDFLNYQMAKLLFRNYFIM